MPDLGHNWLLLRGLARESAHWGEFPSLLQHAFPLANIQTLDLPGTGQFYRQTGPANIQAIATELRKQVREQRYVDQPVTILALSLAGMVAWQWMLRHPDEIAGAVLINTSIAGLNPFYQRLRWQSLGKFLQIMIERDSYRRELDVIRLVSNRRDHDDRIAKAWQTIQLERPVSRSNSLRQIVAAARYRPGKHRPQPPILLLNGRGDRLVAPECSAAIADQWQIELQNHPWAGHDLPLDDPRWIIEKLKYWVESHESQPAFI